MISRNARQCSARRVTIDGTPRLLSQVVMRAIPLVTLALLTLLATPIARGQEVQAAPQQASAATSPAAIQLEGEIVSYWQFGVVVSSPAGAVNGIVATLPVPTAWPEQAVKKMGEEITPLVGKVSYRKLDGVTQMVVTIPRLAMGDEARAVVTLQITKRAITPPSDGTATLLPRKTAATVSKYLKPSPFIESTDKKIRELLPEITGEVEAPWDQSEAIFKWVRENVRYEFAEKISPAIEALEARKGDCEELSSLFIAFCRASKIPARAVWVPGHCYPEFYLEDAEGKGHWYPCQAAGAAYDFAKMNEARPILQKGDNFKVPEERLPQRYVKQTLKAANATANPVVKFVMQQVNEDGTPISPANAAVDAPVVAE